MKLVDILLVEDNESDAELAIHALKKNNLANNLVWLKDGEEALNYLLGSEDGKGKDLMKLPKVVLLDIKMPKVDGLEVLQKLRENNRTKNLPIVILTSSKQETDIMKSYDLRVNSYIVKPVDFKQFAECVKEIGYYWALINKIPNQS